ncbi:NARE ribosyltransferase, partial [Erpornis zantholeuca]|nr:NARE ribosyltransferase [Erpornis zantholeuca]
CTDKMKNELKDLKAFELRQNKNFSEIWKNATALWKKRGSPVSPLSSEDQAIALMAYTMDTNRVYEDFNDAVREAGSSPQQYRDKFHYKAWHFLLTQAVAKLNETQGQQCYDVFRGVKRKRFQAQRGRIVRFGQFASTSFSKEVAHDFGNDTMFRVHTCHGADIHKFSNKSEQQEVLIPPFETFKVISVTWEGNIPWIELRSTGNS